MNTLRLIPRPGGFVVILFLLLTLHTEVSHAAREVPPLPAFPGAEGAGMYATGGRNGSVYIVTNLNASGSGSLADAVSQPNRFIVFAVSGVINLQGKSLDLEHPNITIAGQTAPGEGICLKNGNLHVNASNIIIRHLRVRRGFIADGNMGDAITIKGRGGKGAFKLLENIMLDHLSASWATDENFTVTGNTDKTTAQYIIAAEALDYENPKQTPPRHAFGSLWGSDKDNAQLTIHHMLYAHHRRRCPQASGASGTAKEFAILDFRNNVVYDCIEASSHTANYPLRLNWINNYYKAGPSTEADLRGALFTFNKSGDTRMHASGNIVEESADATRDNWRFGMRYDKGLQGQGSLRVDTPFPVAAVRTQSPHDAYEETLAHAGATLPARDAVDWRIVNEVRQGTGRVIEKETDHPEAQRWPDYRALPAPTDSDQDGLPDYREASFGLDKHNAKDSLKLAADGYAFIEHYANSTNPKDDAPVVYIASAVSRASVKNNTPGVLRVWRNGNTAQSLAVRYMIEGKPRSVVIPAGKSFADIRVAPVAAGGKEKLVTATLMAGKDLRIGCPGAALVVVKN